MSTVKFLYSNYNINNTISQLVAVLKEDYSSFYLAKKYDIIKIMKIKITRKKMKNITIRINSDGEVLVSAPIRVPNSYIESLLKEKEKWIREKIALVEERKKLETKFEEGGKFYYLGFPYIIKLEISLQERCEIKDNNFIIYLKDNSFEKRKKLINQWIYDNFYPYVINRTMEIGESIGYSPKMIKFRDMKTRWGSCNTLSRSITFNHQLYKKSKDIIDYVILHELAHIPYPHPQKEFWDFVEKYMPSWKEKRKQLRSNT